MKQKIKSIFVILGIYVKYIFEILLSPFVSIVLILNGLFCGIFKGSSKISTNLKSENNVNSFINRTKKHINKIPKILLYPLGAVVNIFYNITKSFYNSIDNFFKKRNAVNNHTKKLMREAVCAIVRGETNLLNSFSRRKVTKLFTALLQFTSFITTFGGFVFLLGNLNPIAPIMVAIVIQGGCYYLLNYNSSLKHTGRAKRGVLLTCLVVLSMTTSYIGVFNTIANPVEYMKNNYTVYQEYYNKTIGDEIESNNFEEFNSSKIENNFNSFNNIISEAKSKMATADDIIKNTPTQKTETSNYIDENGNYHSATSTVPIPENQLIVNEQKDLLNDLDSKIKVFQESITNTDAETVYIAYTQLIVNNELMADSSNEYVKEYNNFQNSISQAKDLISLMDSRYSVDDLNIFDVSKSSNSLKELSDLKLPNYEDLASDLNTDSVVENEARKIKKMVDKVNGWIISDDLISVEQIKNKINDKINDSYSILVEKISDESIKNELNRNKNHNTIVNTQALPFYLPFNEKGTYFSEALISAIVAVFTDSVALLFSVALLPRRKSSLYFDKVEKMLKIKEEMIEDCLMYICMDTISNNSQIKEQDMKSLDKVADMIAEIINNVMNGFMKKVKLCYIPSRLNAYGYIDDETINGLSDYEKSIFVTLCNISMIQAFHRDELLTILDDDFNVSEKPDEISANKALFNKYKQQFEEDKIYYIVSRNIHVWFYDNFSELLESSVSPEFDKSNNISNGGMDNV